MPIEMPVLAFAQMQRIFELAALTGLLACTNAGPGTGDDGPGTVDDGGVDEGVARTCIATSSGGGDPEGLEVKLLGTRPRETIASRSGVEVSHWWYTYDDRGRLVVEDHDNLMINAMGIAVGGVDGVPDFGQEIEQNESSAVVHYIYRSTGAVVATTTFHLDANDRVLDYVDGPTGATFSFDADGRLLHADEDLFDPELGPYTTITNYTYDGDRLASRSVLDSRVGTHAEVTNFKFQISGNRIVVPRSYATFAYTYDESGRATQAEVDDDRDGTSNWIVAASYAADGAVTVSSSRDGNLGRTYAFSPECGFTFDALPIPRASQRPAPYWLYLRPAIPNAYE